MNQQEFHFKKWHTFIHIFLYGGVIDYMIAKVYLCKGEQNNMKEHKQLGQFIYFVTLCNLGFLWLKDQNFDKNQDIFNYDIILLFFLFLQFILGNKIYQQLLQSRNFKNVLNNKKFHRFCAFVVYSVGKIRIYFLLDYYLEWNTKILKTLFTLYLILIGKYEKNIFLNILPENLQRKNQYEKVKNNLEHQSISQSNQTFQSMDKDLSDIESVSLQDINWFVFDNKIYDNKNFNHPGGNFITKKMNKKDITKYIFGEQFFIQKKENNKYDVIKHAHDFRFFKYIKKNYLGPINFQQTQNVNSSTNSVVSNFNYQQIPLSILFQESIYQNEFEYNIVKSIYLSHRCSLNIIQSYNKQKVNSLDFYWTSQLGQYLRLYDEQSNNIFLDCCYCLNPNYLRSKIQKLDIKMQKQYQNTTINILKTILNLKDLDQYTESKYLVGVGNIKSLENKNLSINGPQGFNCLGFSGQSTQNLLLVIQNNEVVKFLDLFEILIQRNLISKNQMSDNFHKDYLLDFSNGVKIDLILIFDQKQNDIIQFSYFQINQLLQLQEETHDQTLKILSSVNIYTNDNLKEYEFLRNNVTNTSQVKIKILEHIEQGNKVIWSIDKLTKQNFLEILNIDQETFNELNFI